MQVRQILIASLLAMSAVGAMSQEIDRSETLQARSLAGMQLFLRFSQGVLPVDLRPLEVESGTGNGNGRQHLLRLASYDDVETILAQCRAAGCIFEESIAF